MNPMRRAILAASQNQWMREHAPRFGFMRRAAARFLPGEDVQDAVTAARALAGNGIQSVLSHPRRRHSRGNYREAYAARPGPRSQPLLRKSGNADSKYSRRKNSVD